MAAVTDGHKLLLSGAFARNEAIIVTTSMWNCTQICKILVIYMHIYVEFNNEPYILYIENFNSDRHNVKPIVIRYDIQGQAGL